MVILNGDVLNTSYYSQAISELKESHFQTNKKSNVRITV